MTDERVVKLWERAADSYETVVPYFGRMGEQLAAVAGIQLGERILDVACGKGASLVPAAAVTGPEGLAVGVDVVASMVKAARTTLDTAGCAYAQTAVMDGAALAFPDASFDVVLCGNSLLFLDVERALAEFARVLRPDGRLVVSAPMGGGSNWEFFGRLCKEFGLPQMPLAMPSQQDIMAMYPRVGFAEVSVSSHTIHVNFTDEQTWWRWAWSHGQRWFLEQLTTEQTNDFQKQAFEHLRSFRTEAGIPLDQNFKIAKAIRAGGP